MTAAAAFLRLAEVLDGHRWDELPELLAADFSCEYVHTGETFDRAGWVELNATYPGFRRFLVDEVVGDGDRAAGRARASAEVDGQPAFFGVASFVTARDGLIRQLTEVWTDIGGPVPPGRA